MFIAFVAAAAIVFFLISTGRDPDSPLARMYRTEADLTALKKALNMYYAEYHIYPPAGPQGLRLATDFMSRKGRYLPGGPPPDAWDRPYFYVPSAEYAANDEVAIKNGEQFLAPDTYQLYSRGADGLTGALGASGGKDNIVSWDDSKRWRTEYDRLQSEWKQRPRI
jgi:hypothetical protein